MKRWLIIGCWGAAIGTIIGIIIEATIFFLSLGFYGCGFTENYALCRNQALIALAYKRILPSTIIGFLLGAGVGKISKKSPS